MYLDIVCLKETKEGVPTASRNWTEDPIGELVFKIPIGQRDFYYRNCGLRYSKFQSFSTVLGIFSSRYFELKSINKVRTGVISLNGPHALDIANEVSEVIITKGEKFVNPIQFPFTLQSAVACEIASFFNFQGAAFSVGYDRYAFLDAINHAYHLISYDALDNILLLNSGILKPYYRREKKEDFDHAVSIAILITNKKIIDLPLVEILEIYSNTEFEQIGKLATKFNIEKENIYSLEQNDSPTLSGEDERLNPLFFVLTFILYLQKCWKSKVTNSRFMFLINGIDVVNIIVLKF